MGHVAYMSIQHNQFIKRVKWVGSGQPPLLTGWARVKQS